MRTAEDDERGADIDARIAALPAPAPAAQQLAQVHARARAVFVAARTSGGVGAGPRPRRWVALWNRALEPILVVAVVAGYLTWTAAAVGALHRPPGASPVGIQRGHR
jgi:hypothetical protein